MRNYKEEINELRAIDRDDSREYLIQFTLVGVTVFTAYALLGLWPLLVWFFVLYGLSTIERYLHRRTPQPYSRRLYYGYLALGTLIACWAMTLPVYLWTFDHPVYHFASLIYSVGMVLNTFILRSRAWPSLLCYAIPNGLAMMAIAAMFVMQEGLTVASIMAIMLAVIITVYLYVMVKESVRRVKLMRQTNKELIKAQRAETLANFSGGVAHDFNNLLGVISASLEQAQTEESPAERRAMIEQALVAVRRGSGLTRQLLTVGRQSEFATEQIDVCAFIRELEQFLRRIIPSHIHVRVYAHYSIRSIVSEPSLLQSMLINLALNARDAMPGGGVLDISLEKVDVTSTMSLATGDLQPGSYAAFTVRDNGRGIPSEVFGRVLEPFFSTRAKGDGTGLGLAMVAGFSQQVGGALDIVSKEGQGTRIRFFLPLAAGWENPPVRDIAALPVVEATGDKGKRVLLVEDELALNRMLEKHLTRQGYSVMSCEDGDTAFAAVETGYKPDIVLTDIIMTGTIQGTDLVAQLKDRLPETLFIMMSGYSFSHEQSASVVAGDASCFRLAKPFRLAELDRVLTGQAEPLQA